MNSHEEILKLIETVSPDDIPENREPTMKIYNRVGKTIVPDWPDPSKSIWYYIDPKSGKE